MHFLVRLLPVLILIISACTQSNIPESTYWHYIAVDSSRQKWGDWDKPDWLRYFGIDYGDLNRDGNLDIVSGRYIYLNPGDDMTDPWERHALDENVDAIFFINADGDPFADIIAQALPGIYWYEALDIEGTKYSRKLIATIPPTGHVNSQGFEKAQVIAGGKPELLIASNGEIHCIIIPDDPASTDQWPTFRIAANTSDEGIGVGDIDMDGDVDFACGRRPSEDMEPNILVWYENPGTIEQPWASYEIGETEHPIDRIEVADLDGDDVPEIVVAEERYPGLEPDGHLLWFKKNGSVKQAWKSNVIVQQYSMNNLDVADIDGDGDIDIITNEHKGEVFETQIWMNDGSGKFTKYLVDTGKENHLGTQVADLDGDGDLDIAGCAWDNYRWLHLWRNDRVGPIKAGSIFREYHWIPGEKGNEPFLRVGGRLGYKTNPDHYPAELIKDGYIRLADDIDLKKATHAELVIERLQSHEDTKNLRISLNGGSYVKVPEPPTIPDTSTNYMFHFNPRIPVALSDLEEGFLDFSLVVDTAQAWNWPQNLIYGITLRVYYEPGKSRFEATVSGPKNGLIQAPAQILGVETKDLEEIQKVDYIVYMTDVNWPGDGIYRQWQFHQHETDLRGQAGSSGGTPFRITWDTEWIPDQPEPMKILARIELKNGLIHYTEPLEGLNLKRDYSVKLLKPYDQPPYWSTRSGEFSEKLYLSWPAENIQSARMYWKSWSPCYSEGLALNGKKIMGRNKEWPCYDYFEHTMDLDKTELLQQGENQLTTLLTPLYEGKMVHGMEVQWPGIQLKLKIPETKSDPSFSEVMYEERPHFLIHTNQLTYYYDKQGGGFSRIIDRQGNDWVSFRMEPWGNYPESAASSFRGLPNLVYQGDDDGAGHPGHDRCETVITGQKLVTTSKSGKWKWSWEFHDSHAILEIIRTDPSRKYWFLYEGTPGGSFKPSQSYTGTNLGGPVTEQNDYFNGDVLRDNFQWIYTGTELAEGALYMIQMTKDTLQDMVSFLGNNNIGLESENGMTVFGFGREEGAVPLLEQPQKFIIGYHPERINTTEQHEQFKTTLEKKFQIQ